MYGIECFDDSSEREFYDIEPMQSADSRQDNEWFDDIESPLDFMVSGDYTEEEH